MIAIVSHDHQSSVVSLLKCGIWSLDLSRFWRGLSGNHVFVSIGLESAFILFTQTRAGTRQTLPHPAKCSGWQPSKMSVLHWCMFLCCRFTGAPLLLLLWLVSAARGTEEPQVK